jgi:hypothetical protein
MHLTGYNNKHYFNIFKRHNKLTNMAKSDWQPGTSVMPENSYTQKWDSICCEQNAKCYDCAVNTKGVNYDWFVLIHIQPSLLLINEKNDTYSTKFRHVILHILMTTESTWALLVLCVSSIIFWFHLRNIIPLRSMLRGRNHESWVDDTHGPLVYTSKRNNLSCIQIHNAIYMYLFSVAALLLTRFLRTNTIPAQFRTRQFFKMRNLICLLRV